MIPIDYSEQFYSRFEEKHEHRNKNDKYSNTYFLFSWLVEAITYTKILPSDFYENEISLLYGESLKRMRSANLLATKGYYSDGLSMLRSVFELMKAINAIQNGVVTVSDYISGFLNDDLSENPDFMKISTEHGKKMDQKCNAFDNRDIPDHIRPTLRTFKDYMHKSTHKSSFNLTLNYIRFRSYGNRTPFDLDEPDLLFENYFNCSVYVLLMFMRNLVNSGYLTAPDRDLFVERIEHLESDYYKMNMTFHKDMVDYLRTKFSIFTNQDRK